MGESFQSFCHLSILLVENFPILPHKSFGMGHLHLQSLQWWRIIKRRSISFNVTGPSALGLGSHSAVCYSRCEPISYLILGDNLISLRFLS